MRHIIWITFFSLHVFGLSASFGTGTRSLYRQAPQDPAQLRELAWNDKINAPFSRASGGKATMQIEMQEQGLEFFVPRFVHFWNPDFVKGPQWLHSEIETAIQRARMFRAHNVSLLFDRKSLYTGAQFPVKPTLPGSVVAKDLVKFLNEEAISQRIELIVVEDDDLTVALRKEITLRPGINTIAVVQVPREPDCDSYLKNSQVALPGAKH